MEENLSNITERAKNLSDSELLNCIESILFVSGEPVYFEELSRLFGRSKDELRKLLSEAEAKCREEKRGVMLYVTEDSVQLVSNKEYDGFIVEFLQPTQTKSFSQSMIETLTIIAYRQPITRSEIDAIRGIRSEYSVSQLLKQGFIQECGRKDVLGRPMLFGTTDKFLRKFALHSLEDLPEFEKFSEMDIVDETGE